MLSTKRWPSYIFNVYQLPYIVRIYDVFKSSMKPWHQHSWNRRVRLFFHSSKILRDSNNIDILNSTFHFFLSLQFLVWIQSLPSLVAMKFFQSFQKSCQIMGILPSEQNPRCSFNLITLLISSPAILFFISSMAFLLFKAQSIQEYRDSFFATTSSFASLVNFTIIIWKMPNYLKLIKKFEGFVQKSE